MQGNIIIQTQPVICQTEPIHYNQYNPKSLFLNKHLLKTLRDFYFLFLVIKLF